jgi:pentafunctional AROM polypeptide
LEIRKGLSLIGEIKPKKFAILGKPIGASRSPALHNHLFTETGLPHNYGSLETDNAQDAREFIRSPDFGGASVTIPLKLDIIPLLDEIAPEAKVIGAVNTIIPLSEGKDQPARLIGRNTDWQGIVHCLRQAGAYKSSGDSSAIVIGGGGTARAAIYALHNMGYNPICILGRSPAKLKNMAATFPASYNIQLVLESTQVESIPRVAIGTIPGDEPIDPNIREVLCHMFDHAQEVNKGLDREGKPPRVLLEMAYKPDITPLMRLASDAGWATVSGLEALVGQGVYQVGRSP